MRRLFRLLAKFFIARREEIGGAGYHAKKEERAYLANPERRWEIGEKLRATRKKNKE
jgi:hypothetical protein